MLAPEPYASGGLMTIETPISVYLVDDVPELRVTTTRAPEDLDALDAAGAGVVGDVQDGTHLDHGSLIPPRTS